MKKTVIIFILLVLLVIGSVFFWRWSRSGEALIGSSEVPASVTNYRCSGGKTIKATYLSSGMKLDLSDGRSVHLDPAPVASGARYADDTGSIVFWSKQYSAFLEESGQTSYGGCIVHPLPFAADAR